MPKGQENLYKSELWTSLKEAEKEGIDNIGNLIKNEEDNKSFQLYVDEIKKKAEEVAISKEKIIFFNQEEYDEYCEYARNPFHKRLEMFDQCNEKIELLCTGISYHNNGISVDCLPIPSFNLALRAQDLFYFCFTFTVSEIVVFSTHIYSPRREA